MNATETDVVVIGGGPAGSTMASFLARKGHSVTVLERDLFPREHVGESMLPFCYRVFEDLGILEEMKERWVRKPGVRFIDVDGVTNTAWCFWHHIKDDSALSFQVIRSEFDQVLLDHSASLGAVVHQQTRVTDVDLDDDGATVTATGPGGERRTFRARFVVDASGRDTFMSNRLGTKVAHKELERTAISCSYWKGAKFTGTLAEGLIQIVYLGGEKQGWIWCIPLGNDRVSVGVVVNSSYYRGQRAELLEEGFDDWKLALYLKEIDAAPYTKDILDGATMERDLAVNGDYSYLCKEKWGDRFCLVGDASAFIDPIFSSGVFMAMRSAQILSDAVDARLTDKPKAEATFAEAYERVVGAYDVIDRLIRLFYTPEAINFAQLGSADGAFVDFEHYQNAIAVYHFLIGGDFFEVAHKYQGFIDSLRDPKTFASFKNLVIDRPNLSATSCGIDHDIAFHPGLLVHEPRREAERI
ncbi:MAG TPA: NAD(P)/FAD-dependent oxidoreductase [Acidimicrobiia bacterium]|nr:NAD(P)/FAD-dependent oxidoreductase [Acidimicrobiia bacterium]